MWMDDLCSEGGQIVYDRGGQLFLLGGHFEKAAFSGGP